MEKTFLPSTLIFISILSGVVIIILGVMFYPSTLEDAFITFRYSEHLAEGYGFGAWNTNGERVEGYTSFLWMGLLGVLSFLGINPLTASKIIGIIAHLLLSLCLILVPLIMKKSSFSNIFPLMGVFLSGFLPVSFYAASGMETILFSWLICVYFLAGFLDTEWSEKIFLVVGVLLLLVRPEGVLVVGLGIGFVFLLNIQSQRPQRSLIYSIGIFGSVFLIFIVFRYAVFQDIVPNTYWAKAGGVGSKHLAWGKKYLREWQQTHVLLYYLGIGSLGVILIQWKKISKDWLTFWSLNFVTVLLISIYILRIGGDNEAAFPLWRHFIQIFPSILFLAFAFIVIVLKRYRYLQLAIVIVVLLITNYSLLDSQNHRLRTILQENMVNFPSLSHLPPNPYYIWLANFTDQDTTIASSLGGELPYVVDAIHIDILGLNTRHIALEGTFDPNGPVDSKTDMLWVLEQRPDIIEGYLSATRILNNEPANTLIKNWRFQMNYDLITSPIFIEEYCFFVDGPYADLDRALFFRMTYFSEGLQFAGLDCIQIGETSLVNFQD